MQPRWTRTLPDASEGQGLQIIRTPENRPLQLWILSHEILATPTHFYGGKTVPCCEGICKACDAAVPWRIHVYLAVFSEQNGRRAILEITQQAADNLVLYFKAHATLRGARIEVKRANRKPNGRVLLAIYKPKDVPADLPPEPDVMRVMNYIWGLTPKASHDTGRVNDRPTIRVDGHEIKRLQDNPQHGPPADPPPAGDATTQALAQLIKQKRAAAAGNGR